MRASSVSIASVLALLASSGGVAGFTSIKATTSRAVGAAQRQQQQIGSRRRRAHTVVSMSPTVPPQLPDVNQNLSGGDFDK